MIKRGSKKEIPPPAPEPTGSELKWWRNKGGTFRLNKHRVIHPNQTFQAREDEIVSAFRDIIVPVEPRPTPPKTAESKSSSTSALTPVDPVKSEYRVEKDEATGFWNVVDPQGKVVNEQPIEDEQEALDLAKALSS